jgi:hypothetical protein
MAHDFIIPKHKRLTGKAKLQEETKRAVKLHMEVVCKDRLYLLAIVTGGIDHYRKIAGKAFSGFLVDQTVIDGMFHFFVEQAGPDPKKQFEELQRAELVALKLDRLKGLAAMLTDEKHLDAVLDKWISEPAEKAALRSQLLLLMKSQQAVMQ